MRNELILNDKKPDVNAFTELLLTTYELDRKLAAVIPDILLPEHLDIDLLPSFLAMISMLPCGQVDDGFMIGVIENLIPALVSTLTKLTMVTWILVGVMAAVH